MTSRTEDLALTAIAPVIWGSTYIVTTELLPNYSPISVALLRALPAGLLLLAFTRKLPSGIWWLRIFALGALNFSVFWSLLFVAAYRLQGGVAATVGAIQPLIVVFLAAQLLGSSLRPVSLYAAILGLAGVALLVLAPGARLDFIGVAAGLGSALSMAFGTVLTRKWQPPVTLLTLTGWQLTAGGILLIPVSLFFAPAMPSPTLSNLFGLIWLGLIGAALTYIFWFRGIVRIEPALVSLLGFLSPLTAILLGWLCLGQSLTPIQIAGVGLIIASIWLGQKK